MTTQFLLGVNFDTLLPYLCKFMRLAEIFYANKNRPKAVFSLCFLISRNLGPGFAGFRKKDRDPLLVGRRFAFLLSGLCQYTG